MFSKFKIIPIIGLMGVALIANTVVFAEEKLGKDLAEMSFESVKNADHDYIDMGDVEAFRKNIFLSMDQDDNTKLTFEEFFEWDYGFKLIAEETNKSIQFETAMKIVFSLWDLDNNNEISNTEHRKAMIIDFNRADLNADGILSKEEYLRGFLTNIAFKAALKD